MILENKIIDNISSYNVQTKSIKLIKKSLNSSIYSVNYKDNKAILKIYKSDDILRIKRETAVLKLLKKRNFTRVPQILESNFENKFIIMSLVVGENPNYDKSFIEKLARYINNMQLYIKYKDKQNLPNASEAAFSLDEHFKKTVLKLNFIRQKLELFKSASEIIKIIDNKILPWITYYKKIIKNNYSDFEKDIDDNEKILSQSDIGSHNTFIFNNKIYTYDYEYAGIDDPSKTFCDLVINPNILINDENFKLILKDLKNIRVFKNCYDKALIMLPLYRYKWFAIIINSFLKNIKTDQSNALIFLEKSKVYLEKTNTPINHALYNNGMKVNII